VNRAKIRQACESHLKALAPEFPTAWPNVNFNPPDGPFQAPFILYAEPDDRGFRDSAAIQRGIFIITLLYPTNQGPFAAQSKAEDVADHFKRGTSVAIAGEGSHSVIFDRTPEITSGDVEENRFVVRVKCRFYSQLEASL
jgi:hypothetical protein